MVSFSWMSSLAFAITFTFTFGLAVTLRLSLLSSTIHECVFAIGVVVDLLFVCSCLANSPTSIVVSSKTSLLTTLGLKSESFAHYSFSFTLSTMFSAYLFSHAFTNWSDESSFEPFHHVKTPPLHPSNLQFPGQPFQPWLNVLDSTSNVVSCPVGTLVHVNCHPGSIIYAFTGSFRVLLSISKLDARVW